MECDSTRNETWLTFNAAKDRYKPYDTRGKYDPHFIGVTRKMDGHTTEEGLKQLQTDHKCESDLQQET